MIDKVFLTEDQVLDGVISYLQQKGKTTNKEVKQLAEASTKQHGVDLHIKLADEKNQGNNYYIEAKGNLRSDGNPAKSTFNTNFRSAISQIILRMRVDSRRNNYIYGIAMPDSEIEKAIAMIRDNWALSELRLRLYGAYFDEAGRVFAHEYMPNKIYQKGKRKQ